MRIQILQPHDEWNAIYVNGTLVWEGQDIREDEIIEAVLNAAEITHTVEYGSYDEDKVTRDSEGNRVYKGNVIYFDGSGAPETYPL